MAVPSNVALVAAPTAVEADANDSPIAARFAADRAVIGIETFGASAPFQKLYEEYGITAAAAVRAVRGVS